MRWIKRIFARYDGLGLCSIAATWLVICFSCQLKVSLMLFMAILIQLGRNCEFDCYCCRGNCYCAIIVFATQGGGSICTDHNGPFHDQGRFFIRDVLVWPRGRSQKGHSIHLILALRCFELAREGQ